MNFSEDHLKITKVKTQNGITPLFDEQGRPLKKVVFAPDSKESRRLFDDQNSKLPNHLKMTIERIPGYKPQPVQSAPENNEELEKLRSELAALKVENETLAEKLVNKEPALVSENGLTQPNATNGSIKEKQTAKNEKV